MELREYMAIKRRMGKFDKKKRKCRLPCDACPLEYNNNGTGMVCYWFEMLYPEKAEDIVKQWAKEHPAKTYAQDFFSKFPRALKETSGEPRVCREYVYGGDCRGGDNCVDCWNEPMEEDPAHE